MRPARVRAPTGCGRLAVPAPFGHARPHRAIRRRRAPAHGACGGTRPRLDVRRGQRPPPAAGGDRRSAGLGLRCPLGRCRRRRHVPVLPAHVGGRLHARRGLRRGEPIGDARARPRDAGRGVAHGQAGVDRRRGRASAPAAARPGRRQGGPALRLRLPDPLRRQRARRHGVLRRRAQGARRRAAGHDEQPGVADRPVRRALPRRAGRPRERCAQDARSSTPPSTASSRWTATGTSSRSTRPPRRPSATRRRRWSAASWPRS